jgi:hypothetical protein
MSSLKQFFGAKSLRMASRGSQASKRGSGSGCRAPKARSDANEALNNALAEVEDTVVALEAEGSAGASGGVPAAAPPLPAALLERRYNKEKAEKENANKEKELFHKQWDGIRAQLELAKANPGDVVQITCPNTSAPRKVCFKVQTAFLLSL